MAKYRQWEREHVYGAHCCIELRFFGIYICVRDSGGNSTKNTCYKKIIHVRSPIHPISNSVTYKRNEIWFWNMHERKFSHKNIESHPLLDNDRTFCIITTTTPEYYLDIHLCTYACVHAHVFVMHGRVGIRADVSVLDSRTKRIHCMCTLNRHNNSGNSHRIESI